MPDHVTNTGNLISMMQSGVTPIGASVSAGLAAVGVGWAHWHKVKEKGHFDNGIDAECAAQAGLDAEGVAHVEEWNPKLRERARKFFVFAKEHGVPFNIRWALGRERGLRADYDRQGGIELIVTQPAPPKD